MHQSLHLLQQSTKNMKEHPSTSLPYLEAVAKMRYALSVVAELIYSLNMGQTTGQGDESTQWTNEAYRLMKKAKVCCSHSELNEREAGPAVYLVKLLVRQYGHSFLTTLTTNSAMAWVVPIQFRQHEVLLEALVDLSTNISLVLRRSSSRLIYSPSTIHVINNFAALSLMLLMVIN